MAIVPFAVMVVMVASIWGIIKPYAIRGYKPTRWMFLASLIAMFVIVGIFAPEPTPEQKKQAAEDHRQENVREAERKADEALETQRQSMGIMARAAIKNAARNPDSVSFETVYTDKQGSVVCVVYRAQNGFGGMNKEMLAVDENGAHQNSSFWNKHCVGSDFYEV